MTMQILLYILLLASGAWALYELTYGGPRRGADHVLEDLKAAQGPGERMRFRSQKSFSLDSELAQLGLFSKEERAHFMRTRFMLPVGIASFVLIVRLFIAPAGVGGHIVLVLGALSFGFLLQRRRERRMREEFLHAVEFYLPVVMERLVMGAQAGLDILPAIRAILEVDGIEDPESQAAALAGRGYDPVSRLLLYAYRLTESGLSFDQSLSLIAEKVESSPLRHAFIHLAVAHREGGELVAPLRELSDATQLYLQEAVEEEIAKMPVRATAPLVLTFAGLLVFFLASPLLQILDFIAKAKVG